MGILRCVSGFKIEYLPSSQLESLTCLMGEIQLELFRLEITWGIKNKSNISKHIKPQR